MYEESFILGRKQAEAWDIPYRGDEYALRREVSVDVECICPLANRTEECVCGATAIRMWTRVAETELTATG